MSRVWSGYREVFAHVQMLLARNLLMTKIEALEFALQHVRNYHDRCYLQFLLSMERRKDNESNS